MSSFVFPPSVGGIETVSQILARDFVSRGTEVKVITATPAHDREPRPFEVVRRPTARALLKLVRWSDVFFHNNMSLQFAWPLVFVRKPWVVAFHTWISRTDGSRGWQDRIKQLVSRRARCISISRAVAAHLSVPSTVVGNPYDEEEFRSLPGIERNRDLIFLGRLVSDKGVDVLIRALSILKDRGTVASLTIVGKGPEEESLRELSRSCAVGSQIEFLGEKTGSELVRILNAHKIIVVPSRWREPFGIVALEGIACGCVAVGSEDGGLSDAIGPCGLTFPNGDASRLAEVLCSLLSNPHTQSEFQKRAADHLKNFRRDAIAAKYLKVLTDAVDQYDLPRTNLYSPSHSRTPNG
jgi:glycosyltransferase involved in cell wall biosynthesis